MPTLPAYDGITLALGGDTVRLRPSLRAAHRLGVSPDDMRLSVFDFHLGTIREIITTAATDRQEATAFLAKIDATPLQIVADSIVAPLVAFLGSFAPADDRAERQAPSDPPMAWPDVVRMFYRVATAVFGWTPETAWNATLTEINEVYLGRIEIEEAIASRMSDDTDQPTRTVKQADPEQAARNIAAGLDPEFDRAGLRALKAKLARGG